jgi:glyoxylase-like metal-dependent hydrolase (beta-lactamase superfamily II)
MTDDAYLLMTVGDVRVFMVPEVVIPTSVRWLLPDAPREQVEAARAWMQPAFMDENGYLIQSVHTYVLKTPTRVVLIDTGVGNAKARAGGIPAFNMLDTPFLQRLASIGVQPDDVDLVLCTHMHTDHVGWDARRRGNEWTPTFPRARHAFARPEYEAFTAALRRSNAQAAVWADSIEPVVRAGLADVVDADADFGEGIRLEPSFGHTPGHVSVVLESGGGEAVFIGDVMHSPLQALFPRLRCALGGPEEASREARLAVLERYADTGTPLFGAHFGAHGGGYVRREGPAFRFDALG